MLFCGCASTANRERAIRIAEQEVVKQGWTNYRVESVRRVGGRWRVEIWWLPKTPGGYTEIEVSDDGKVVTEYPGL